MHISLLVLKNLPITQCLIKRTHPVTWCAAVIVICKTEGDQ